MTHVLTLIDITVQHTGQKVTYEPKHWRLHAYKEGREIEGEGKKREVRRGEGREGKGKARHRNIFA